MVVLKLLTDHQRYAILYESPRENLSTGGTHLNKRRDEEDITWKQVV